MVEWPGISRARDRVGALRLPLAVKMQLLPLGRPTSNPLFCFELSLPTK
jgi:hypothetical protein